MSDGNYELTQITLINGKMAAKNPTFYLPRIREAAGSILDLLKQRDEEDHIPHDAVYEWQIAWGFLIQMLQLSDFQSGDFNIRDVISAKVEYENSILFNVWLPEYQVRRQIIHRLILPLAIFTCLR